MSMARCMSMRAILAGGRSHWAEKRGSGTVPLNPQTFSLHQHQPYSHPHSRSYNQDIHRHRYSCSYSYAPESSFNLNKNIHGNITRHIEHYHSQSLSPANSKFPPPPISISLPRRFHHPSSSSSSSLRSHTTTHKSTPTARQRHRHVWRWTNRPRWHIRSIASGAHTHPHADSDSHAVDYVRADTSSSSSNLTAQASGNSTPIPIPVSLSGSLHAPVSWIDTPTSIVPTSLRPYLHLSRVDKPIGTYLLFFPCAWGLLFSTPPTHILSPLTIELCLYFFIGALVMRGAGCTVNDLWDQKYDKSVSRTSLRPLASGTVTTPKAIIWTLIQCIMGIAVVIQLDAYSLALAFMSLPLVFIYPLCKRYTHWPQLVLGCTFNWGILVGGSTAIGRLERGDDSFMMNMWRWCSNTHTDIQTISTTALSELYSYLSDLVQHSFTYVTAQILLLYVSAICWTIVYDTIYAFQDVEDDRKLGLKSTAIMMYAQHKAWLYSFASMMILSMIAAGYMNHMGICYYIISVGFTALHLVWQISTVNRQNRANCAYRFISNKWIGLMVLIGIVIDKLMSQSNDLSHKVSKHSNSHTKYPMEEQPNTQYSNLLQHHNHSKDNSAPPSE